MYVILESFGANFYGLLGNPLDPTPRLDELGRSGLVFERFIVPTGGNTARSVFAALTGIPDVTPNDSSASREPLLVNQHMILDEFNGYDKYYFVGGSASWRNIRGFLTQGVRGLELYEEGSYTEPRVDVWGISDLSLFREAARVFRNRDPDQPFIAVIQTSGNHLPFTIPRDNDGFVRRSLPADESRWYGFSSEDRYNAVRFMDHSVGRLIDMMRGLPGFDHTIFVFHGDHGSASARSPHMPRAVDELNLVTFFTPLIIHAPGLIRTPGRIRTPASAVDVFPTLAALAGIPYTNTTFGRDLLQPLPGAERYVPVFSNFRPEGLVGVMGDRFLFRRDRQNRATLHDLTADDPRQDVRNQYPAETRRLQELTDAMFETARYMLHFNRRLPRTPADASGA